jgi:RNA polymerase sigma factor (sigma-70 family)
MITNDAIVKMIGDKDYDAVIKACETIIYHYLHRTNFWNIFINERDDLVQEGRLAIYKCALTYDNRSKFTTYVHNAVRNSIYNYVKKMKLFDNLNVVEMDEDVYNISDDTTMSELYENVINDLLNSKHSDILHAYFVDEYTQQDIADKLKLSQQWVGTIVNTFRREMYDRYKIDLNT